jgi:hypothetical protein
MKRFLSVILLLETRRMPKLFALARLLLRLLSTLKMSAVSVHPLVRTGFATAKQKIVKLVLKIAVSVHLNVVILSAKTQKLVSIV